jgi:anti-sigma regulatory factor (Ser/Thr protein kinase)
MTMSMSAKIGRLEDLTRPHRSSSRRVTLRADVSFQHEALLYDGLDGFAAGALPFIREGLDAGEPMLVAVGADRIGLLRDELGAQAAAVQFVDMAQLGRNPGRIIPAWRDFLTAHHRPGAAIRGIGEPIWAGRTPEELVECQLHEALLNVAFADVEGFRLLCPYDRSALDDGVLHEACRSHPGVVDAGHRMQSPVYRSGDQLLTPFTTPLAPPHAVVDVLAYDRRSVDEVRAAVAARGAAAGLDAARAGDLVLAASEAAANSVRHGGGTGVLRMWEDGDTLICEVKDRGRVVDPLAGRRKPAPDQPSGWGLYIAHQVCDLVQLRSDDGGTIVRLHMAAAQPAARP